MRVWYSPPPTGNWGYQSRDLEIPPTREKETFIDKRKPTR